MEQIFETNSRIQMWVSENGKELPEPLLKMLSDLDHAARAEEKFESEKLIPMLSEFRLTSIIICVFFAYLVLTFAIDSEMSMLEKMLFAGFAAYASYSGWKDHKEAKEVIKEMEE